jgi:hypothetical protein
VEKKRETHTFLCGSLGGGQDGGWRGRDWGGLGDGETEAVVHLLYGIAACRDKGGLAWVVALQDEHPAQVIVEARPCSLDKATEPLRKLHFFLRKLVYFRIALVDLLRDLVILCAQRCGTAAQGMSNESR